MRSKLAGALVAAILLGAAAAQAATLYGATWFQVTQGVPMTRTTAQLGASGSSTPTSIAVSLSYPQFTTSFFVPKTFNAVLDLHIKITQGGPQVITATPAMAGGTPGIPGTVVIMTAQHIGMGVNQSMYNAGAVTLLRVPLSQGAANQVTSTFIVTGVTHVMTVDFYGWTPGTQTFTGLTTKGVSLPDVVAMGSFNLDGFGQGYVTLVSPTKVSIDGALAQRRSASFTTLKLTFVPEPAALLLLGAAGLALVLARRL